MKKVELIGGPFDGEIVEIDCAVLPLEYKFPKPEGVYYYGPDQIPPKFKTRYYTYILSDYEQPRLVYIYKGIM